MSEALPREPTDAMVAAGVACLHSCLDALRALPVGEAERELARRMWARMAEAFEKAASTRVKLGECAASKLADLREAGFTVSGGHEVEGETRYQVMGPDGVAYGFIPTRGAGFWWLIEEPGIKGGGITSLIRRATAGRSAA